MRNVCLVHPKGQCLRWVLHKCNRVIVQYLRNQVSCQDNSFNLHWTNSNNPLPPPPLPLLFTYGWIFVKIRGRGDPRYWCRMVDHEKAGGWNRKRSIDAILSEVFKCVDASRRTFQTSCYHSARILYELKRYSVISGQANRMHRMISWFES